MAAGDVIVVREDGSGKKANVYDGTDDYMLADAHAVARVAANDTVGTYTAWIYIDNVTTEQTILSAGDNNSLTEYLKFFINSSGELMIRLNHGGATQFQISETTASIIARKWYHVAVVQNGTRPILYINGTAIAITDDVATNLTFWYDGLTLVDKFAIGIFETNATHINDFKGAIGQVKYFALDLTAAEILRDMKGETQVSPDGDAARATDIETARVFDISMESDGTTDSGSGADNGTLTGDAFYGGIVSDHSYAVHANVTGHAAEVINTVIDGTKYVSLIKRGD